MILREIYYILIFFCVTIAIHNQLVAKGFLGMSSTLICTSVTFVRHLDKKYISPPIIMFQVERECVEQEKGLICCNLNLSNQHDPDC